MHNPLLDEMKKFKKVLITRDKIIYHGCREFSLHTDFSERKLLGTRKWFSDDQAYAIDYAFFEVQAGLGRHLLWKCKFKTDIECLKGSQSSLIKHSPWGAGFPTQFPNNFSIYARHLQGEQDSYVFLDHEIGKDKFREILVTFPNNLIEIIDVYVLPNQKDLAVEHAALACV